MIRRGTLLTAGLLLLGCAPAQATDFSISVFPAHGEKATPEEWQNAYNMATGTPGIGAYFFAATWGELTDSDHNRFEEFRTTVAAGKASSLPGYLGIQVINTGDRGMPDEFKRTRWTRAAVLAKFDETLQKMAAVAGNDVKWLSIGNEADVYLARNEDEVDDYLKFYKQAAQTARRYFPNAKIGITVTHDGIEGERHDLAAKLIAASDAVFITYYPVTPDLKIKAPGQVERDFATLVQNYPDKQIVVQELGFPTRGATGATEAGQAGYFQNMIANLRGIPNVAFVNLFLLHDFSPAVCSALNKAYKNDNPAMAEMLCSFGLIDTRGKPKPAWQAVRESLKPPAAGEKK